MKYENDGHLGETIEIGDNKIIKKRALIKIVIIILIIIVISLIGFYCWNLKVNNEKNDNSIFQDDNTSNIVDGDYTINVESNDINNTFRSLLEKNGIIYSDNNNLDITFNYGQVTDNINLKIEFISKSCSHIDDMTCDEDYFNKSKMVNVIINGEIMKYYNGYNNYYDVLDSLFNNGYIAIINDKIYFINNSDSFEEYQKDEINQPSISIYGLDGNYSNYNGLITKYYDQDGYSEESCPITYSNNEIYYCTTYDNSGNSAKILEYNIPVVNNNYSAIKTNNGITIEMKNNDSSTSYINNNSSLNDVVIDNSTVKELYKFLNSYTNFNYPSEFDSFYQDIKVTYENLGIDFIQNYIYYNTTKNSGSKINSCSDLAAYGLLSSNDIVDCNKYGIDDYQTDNEIKYINISYDDLNKTYKAIFNTTSNFPTNNFQDTLDYCNYSSIKSDFLCNTKSGVGPYEKFLNQYVDSTIDDDEIVIYTRTLLEKMISESYNFDSTYIYSSSYKYKILKRYNNTLIYDDNSNFYSYLSQGQLYKSVFKKASNGNYYWYSTEPTN